MKFAERIMYASAGAHFAAGFVGQAIEWRAIYYGSFLVGSIAAASLAITWFRKRHIKSGN